MPARLRQLASKHLGGCCKWQRGSHHLSKPTQYGTRGENVTPSNHPPPRHDPVSLASTGNGEDKQVEGASVC